MSFLNQANKLEDLWVNGLEVILNEGSLVIGERGVVTKEYCGILSEISFKDIGRVPMMYPLKERVLKEYEEAMLTPDLGGFLYTYGHRIREYFGVDQLDIVIEKLKKENTRRALVSTWDQRNDLQAEEVPCMIMISFQKIMGRLSVFGVWRSHDFYGAFPANVYAIKKLSEYVAENTGLELDQLTILSVNAHIYEADIEEAVEVMRAHQRNFWW